MTGSTTQSASAVKCAALVTHGRPATVGDAVGRVRGVAAKAGVELTDRDDVDLVIVLGGDGTMLRALKRFLGTGVPVLGVNFGRVGFLAGVAQDDLEGGLARAFAGDFVTVELPTLEVEVGGERLAVVNDVVAASASLGRMVELRWTIAGEDLGLVPCDGLICCTPSGSTAYNLSNGGPVLVWGLDAMAITFVAPHSLHARPLVVPRSLDLAVTNLTNDVDVAVLVDGHRVGELGEGESVGVRLGEARSLLATLPESTFFRRYRDTFAS
jgi:NAD+ kinase